jgi:hypothetical protein
MSSESNFLSSEFYMDEDFHISCESCTSLKKDLAAANSEIEHLKSLLQYRSVAVKRFVQSYHRNPTASEGGPSLSLKSVGFSSLPLATEQGFPAEKSIISAIDKGFNGHQTTPSNKPILNEVVKELKTKLDKLDLGETSLRTVITNIILEYVEGLKTTQFQELPEFAKCPDNGVFLNDLLYISICLKNSTKNNKNAGNPKKLKVDFPQSMLNVGNATSSPHAEKRKNWKWSQSSMVVAGQENVPLPEDNIPSFVSRQSASLSKCFNQDSLPVVAALRMALKKIETVQFLPHRLLLKTLWCEVVSFLSFILIKIY